MSSLDKVSICPRCGAEGIKTGETPLPDGNGCRERYQCLDCGHWFTVSAEGVA
jgi:transcriptional regulator NrdR family protein